MRQQGVEAFAYLPVQKLRESRQIVVLGRYGEVLVVDDQDAVVNGDPGRLLRPCHRIQPDVSDKRMPRSQEGFAQGGASRDGNRRSWHDDAWRSHGAKPQRKRHAEHRTQSFQ